jgi:hypothetical protein
MRLSLKIYDRFEPLRLSRPFSRFLRADAATLLTDFRFDFLSNLPAMCATRLDVRSQELALFICKPSFLRLLSYFAFPRFVHRWGATLTLGSFLKDGSHGGAGSALDGLAASAE